MATWPSWTVSDQLSGAGAKTFGRDEYDRAECLKARGIGWPMAQISSSASSFTTIITRSWRVPQYVRSGDTIRLHFWLSHSVDGNAAYARVCETGVTGSTASVTGAGSGTPQLKYSDVVVPDDTWAGTQKTFRIEGYRATSGFVRVTTSKIVGALRVIPA